MTTHKITDTEIRLPSVPYIPSYAEGVAKLIKERGQNLEVLEIAQKGLTTADWAIIFNALYTSSASNVHTLILPTLVTIPTVENDSAELWMEGVKKLTTVSLPKADKPSRVLLHVKRLYREAATLTQVEINDADFDKADWTNIFAQLKEVKNLESISMPHFTGRVDNFDDQEAVLARENLTSINLPSFDTGCISWAFERLNKREDAAITHLVLGNPSNFKNTRFKVEGGAANALPLLVSVVNKNPKIQSLDLTGLELFFPKEKDPSKRRYEYEQYPALNFSNCSFSSDLVVNISLDAFDVKNSQEAKGYSSNDFEKEKNNYIAALCKFFGNARLKIKIPEIVTFSGYNAYHYKTLSAFVKTSSTLHELDMSGHVFSVDSNTEGNRKTFSEIIHSAYQSKSLKVLNLSNCGITPYLLITWGEYDNKVTPAQALYNAAFSNTLEELDLSDNDLRDVYYYQGNRVSEGYLPPRALGFMDNVWGKPVSPAIKFSFDKAHFLKTLMKTKKLRVINLIGTGIGYDDIKGLVKENFQVLTIKYSGSDNQPKDFKVPVPKIASTLAQIFGITAKQVEEPTEPSTAAGSASMGAAGSAGTATYPSASDEKRQQAGMENKELAVATFASEEDARSREQAQQLRDAYQASQSATAAGNSAVAAASTVGAERVIERIELPPSYVQAISDAQQEAARRAAEAARIGALVDAFMDMPESSPTTEVLALPTPSAPPMPTALITASQSDATTATAEATSTTAVAPVPAARPRTQTIMGVIPNPFAALMSSDLNVPTTITGRLGVRMNTDQQRDPLVVPSHIPTVDQVRRGATTQSATPAAPARRERTQVPE